MNIRVRADFDHEISAEGQADFWMSVYLDYSEAGTELSYWWNTPSLGHSTGLRNVIKLLQNKADRLKSRAHTKELTTIKTALADILAN